MAWEEEFKISIPNSAAVTFVTPRKAADWIEHHLEELSRPMSHADIEALIKRVTLEQTGIPEKQYHPDARFIADLGID